jgi:tRNA pseudouridine synthase 10
VLHGAGREDIDALMLGTGRPFVLEIVEPKVRTIDLCELEKNTNQYGKGKIDVSEYRWSSKNELRDLKSSAERTVKKYKALITFEEPISEKKIKEIEEFFKNRPINQRTPQRVSHRRADLIRKKTAFSVQCSRINETHIEAIITCDGGCYVKELISGDNNRTKPSIAEVIGLEAKCKELDVIEIQDGFNEA